MNNFTGNIFDENGDYIMDATILDEPDTEIDFDDVEDNDLDYNQYNFIEENISLFDYLNEDIADISILEIALNDTENNSKKRKREVWMIDC